MYIAKGAGPVDEIVDISCVTFKLVGVGRKVGVHIAKGAGPVDKMVDLSLCHIQIGWCGQEGGRVHCFTQTPHPLALPSPSKGFISSLHQTLNVFRQKTPLIWTIIRMFQRKALTEHI